MWGCVCVSAIKCYINPAGYIFGSQFKYIVDLFISENVYSASNVPKKQQQQP